MQARTTPPFAARADQGGGCSTKHASPNQKPLLAGKGSPGWRVCSTKERSGASWRCTSTAMQAASWGTPVVMARRTGDECQHTGVHRACVHQHSHAGRVLQHACIISGMGHGKLWSTAGLHTSSNKQAAADRPCASSSPETTKCMAQATVPTCGMAAQHRAANLAAAWRLSTTRRLNREAHTCCQQQVSTSKTRQQTYPRRGGSAPRAG